MSLRVREFAKMIDHTLLRPNALECEVGRLCEEAANHHFAAVCVFPVYIRMAARELRGLDVKVATVISFPFGAETTSVKVAAVRDAIVNGADELDVVMNLSRFLSGEFSYVAEELRIIRQEASALAIGNGRGDIIVKVIIETAYLSDEMKRLATQIVAESGADFVKTSTGYAPKGATVHDVALLREEAPGGLAVKASGGIRDLQSALNMLNAGASRIGTSNSITIIKEAENGGLQE